MIVLGLIILWMSYLSVMTFSYFKIKDIKIPLLKAIIFPYELLLLQMYLTIKDKNFVYILNFFNSFKSLIIYFRNIEDLSIFNFLQNKTRNYRYYNLIVIKGE